MQEALTNLACGIVVVFGLIVAIDFVGCLGDLWRESSAVYPSPSLEIAQIAPTLGKAIASHPDDVPALTMNCLEWPNSVLERIPEIEGRLPISEKLIEPPPTELVSFSSEQLRRLCSQHGIKWRNVRGSKHLSKAEMVERLRLSHVLDSQIFR